uniref:Uncharacterized protein n=1 Tax=Arundo donax TaxID=35708 RepID=A0A0A9KE26_ARUDO
MTQKLMIAAFHQMTKAKIFLPLLIPSAAKERRSPLGVNNKTTMHCLGWGTCVSWPLKIRFGKVTVTWLLNIIQISRLL